MQEGTVGLVVPASSWPHGGNWVTAQRIAHNVAVAGWHAEVLPADRLSARVDRGGIEVLHAIHACKSGVEVARVAAARDIPYIVTFSGTDLAIDLRRSETRVQIRRVTHGASAVTAFHDSAAQIATRALPETRDRLVVIPPGSHKLPGQRDRARFGLAEDDFVFLLAAGVRAVKRPHYAVEPLTQLHRRYPQLRLVIAGPLLEADAGQRLQHALSGKPWGIWLGEVVPEDMGTLYRSADVTLNTSVHEGLSNAVMEAMRIGRPLLLSDNPGNRAAAADSARYFHNQTEFLAESEQLITNPLLGRRLANAAKARAEQLFSEEREAASYAAAYERALAQGTRESAACQGPW